MYTKGVIISGGGILAYYKTRSLGDYSKAIDLVLNELIKQAQINQDALVKIGVAGLGTGEIAFAVEKFTEMSCLRKGANYWFPSDSTIIDFGGLGSRVVTVTKDGKILSFERTNRCAAGGGRILENAARVLCLGLEQLGNLSLNSKKSIQFSSSCPVFAETEVISLIASGERTEDILMGIHRSLANMIWTLIEKAGLKKNIVFTGGGALDVGLVRAAEEKVMKKILVPPRPEFVIALGAALAILKN